MTSSWEGNHRSAIALAMDHRLKWFIHLLAKWPSKRDKQTLPMLCMGLGQLYLFFLPSISQRCLVKWKSQFTQFMLHCFPKTGWLCNSWLLSCMASWISGKQCQRTGESDYLLHWHTLPVCFITDQSHHPPCSPCLNKLLLQLVCILDKYLAYTLLHHAPIQ